jgi:DNA-binding winged helix-turn-helix (wHTH) protein/tetratricopeptide (TPR) repeat protein
MDFADSDADVPDPFGERITLAHAPSFTLGGVTVHPSTRQVDCCGDAIFVEPRVMQVLVAFARARGQILSRDDLTRACWEDRVVGEDAISRVISRIRRLGIACGGTFRIETITKVGFRMIVDGETGSQPSLPEFFQPQDKNDIPGPAETAPDAARPRTARRRPIVVAAVIAVGAVALAGASVRFGLDHAVAPPVAPISPVADDDLPADPDTATLYLQARSDWALRKSASIDKAIDEFGTVISRDPGFAPAYAGLADAYILAREFGRYGDDTAFPRAEDAADVALRLDPRLPAAQRANGFVSYWWNNDPAAAGIAFRAALAEAPDDPQTHYWYGNVLADNGRFAAAEREFNAARSLNPESLAIQADWAWASWLAGDHDQAFHSLVAIRTSDPDLAIVHDCLRSIALVQQDYPAYLAETAALVRLRRAPDLARDLAEDQAAYARGADALRQTLVRQAIDSAQPPHGDLAWPALVASAVGNRDMLLRLLREADQRHERWSSVGETNLIAARWHNDGAVTTLLSRRQSLPVV